MKKPQIYSMQTNEAFSSNESDEEPDEEHFILHFALICV